MGNMVDLKIYAISHAPKNVKQDIEDFVKGRGGSTRTFFENDYLFTASTQSGCDSGYDLSYLIMCHIEDKEETFSKVIERYLDEPWFWGYYRTVEWLMTQTPDEMYL